MNASAYCCVVDDTVKTAELKEIVVTAKHDLVKTRGAVTTIQVDRTAFENVGAVSDMLPHLPGLVKTSGGIEVKGLGKPLFYVDGREIKDESELQTLTSDNIRKVQINRAPGAEYPSGTKAVQKSM
ncbi:MAG: Plug domain-containing protein [Prevotella sp.]|nr:Plug domain-containing protein [Prevotella sp.]